MGRTIAGSSKGGGVDFPPMVGIGRKIGQFVRGKVIAQDKTAKGNHVVSLTLMDLEGSTTKSTAKGVYTEVEVNEGDTVQLVANLTDLKDKLPQLAIGDVVTVTYKTDVPSGKGRPKKVFEVTVD